MALALVGDVVTFDPDQPRVEDGAVYIADGLIQAIQHRRDPPPTGFGDAPQVRTRSVIYPGLIDLHNHLAYNYRGLWVADRDEPWETRDQWPRHPSYRQEITLPTRTLGGAAGKAAIKYAEVRALVGGVTSIQGAPPFNRPFDGFLVRNIDNEKFDTGVDKVAQSVIRQNVEGLERYAEKMRDDGMVFVYHLAEGTSDRLLREFDDTKEAGALQPGLIAIHSTALDGEQYAEWESAGAGAIVWSPFSNLWLYRGTTDIEAARANGITICLGSDWGPSGTKNLLGELKVADIWNSKHLNGAFSDFELCQMATANGGDALAVGWGQRVGRIKPGLMADLIAVMPRADDPYRNLIEATERHVRLVMVGGQPLYGNRSLMTAANAVNPEPITVAGLRKTISLVDPAIRDADMSWPDIVDSLEAVRADPEGSLDRSFEIPRGEPEPVRFVGDMPGAIAYDEFFRDPVPIEIPPLDSLFHNAAFFRALEPARAPILDGLLADLRSYY